MMLHPFSSAWANLLHETYRSRSINKVWVFRNSRNSEELKSLRIGWVDIAYCMGLGELKESRQNIKVTDQNAFSYIGF